MIFDACRDNPFGWARSGARGLSVVGSQPTGSILVYATSAGSVAQDGKGRNGIFTQELLRYLQTPGLEIKEVFNRTGAAVRDATGGSQVPAVYSQFFDTAYLGSGVPNTVSATSAKPGDLMVKTSEAGAEIIIDGVSRGESPLLVQALPSGRSLHIEARTAQSYGWIEVKLKAGELGETTIAMAARKGNLVISSSEAAVRVLFDGTDKGQLGSGLIRDLDVGDHRLELVGQDLYFAKTVSIKAEGTVQVQAQVKSVGKLEIRAPADVRVRIRGAGYENSLTGPISLANLSADSYRLEAGGGDYIPVSTSITIKKGTLSVWEPYTTGTLSFTVQPDGASCVLQGSTSIPAAGKVEGIPPGSYRATIRKAGYKDAEMPISVSAGKLTTIKAGLIAWKPGTIVLPQLGAEIELTIDGQRKWGRPGDDGGLRFEGIPSGYPVSVKFIVPGAESSVPDTMVNLDEGETFKLDLASGRFTLPWLAEGGGVSIQGNGLPIGSSPAFRSPLLPIGTYAVTVSGKYPFFGQVSIDSMAENELPHYREMVSAKMSADRSEIQRTLSAKRGKTTWGIVSLGAGLLGAAGAATVYVLGTQAADSYAKAIGTASLQAARSQIELYGSLLPATAALGGLGLGLSPMLLFGGPDPRALQRSVDSLSDQIKALEKR